MKKLLTLIVLIAAFTACKKDSSTQGPPGPQGPPGTSQTGTITGKVTLYDNQGVLQTTNKDSVLVSIKGTTISALTDTTGKYTLDQVPAGVYTMVFSKNGYGTYEQQISFPGNGKLFINGTLDQKPSWKILDIKITGSGMQIITNFTLTPFTNNRKVLFIMGKKNDLDINNPSSFDGYIARTVPGGQTQWYDSWYYNVTYPSQTIFYVKAYPCPFNLKYYYDYETDMPVPVATGEAFNKVFPIVMP